MKNSELMAHVALIDTARLRSIAVDTLEHTDRLPVAQRRHRQHEARSQRGDTDTLVMTQAEIGYRRLQAQIMRSPHNLPRERKVGKHPALAMPYEKF